MAQSSKLTAGVLVKNGHHNLNHPNVINEVKRHKADKEEAAASQKMNKHKRLVKLVKAVKAIRARYGNDLAHQFKSCTKQECGDYLQYKKQPWG